MQDSFRGFWSDLADPIIGLSPMDGVTDAPYRRMMTKYGKPSLFITEFANVEGLARGAVSMLHHFIFDESERPIVAQIYGVETDSFYKVALMCCELGFDGIDINMGCPANKIARRGSGGGMILHPKQAQRVVITVKKAITDWSEGKTMEDAEIRPKIIKAVNIQKKNDVKRKLLPVSVKTRIGFDQIVTKEWIKTLLDVEPANISLHGRTLKQMYSGKANWDEIGKAAMICKGTDTTILGNGDITSVDDAKKKIKDYGVDGVLVGRATFGNPWFFSGYKANAEEHAKVAVEHCELFEKIFPNRKFWAMRKHLAWYMRGFDGARDMRKELMLTNSSAEVLEIFKKQSVKMYL